MHCESWTFVYHKPLQMNLFALLHLMCFLSLTEPETGQAYLKTAC